MAGAIALVGSGEYLPIMEPLERDLVEQGIANGKSPKFVQLATAAGQEGFESLQRWRELGAAQAERIGIEPVFVEAFNREDAQQESISELIEDAALIYLSGGNPMYLAQSLIGTKLFDAIWENWLTGSSLAGCSAGAMALSAEVANPFKLTANPLVGLNVAENLKVIPHFDRYFGWIPKPMAKYLGKASAGVLPIGIDENTALVQNSNTDTWQVWGFGKVTILNRGDHTLIAGDQLEIRSELTNP